MKRLLLLLLVFIPHLLFAQAPLFYQFKKDIHTYAELTADTAVLPAKFGVGDLSAFELKGETFSIFGKNYVMNDSTTLFMFSSNGYIRIDDDTSHIILDGLLHFLDSIDSDSKLSYKTEGNGNDKVFKVQWKNLHVREGAADNYVNFQIWYYKATGIMETHYGPSSASNRSGYTRLTGPNVGLFYSPKDFSRMLEKIWITKYPDSFIVDTNRTITFNTMFGVPENGTVYRFVPKHIATGMAKKEQAGFTIFPNPSDREIVLTFDNELITPVMITLTDVNGRIVSRWELKNINGSVVVPVHNLAQGNYYLDVMSDSFHRQKQISICR